MLLCIDRAAAENQVSELQPIFTKLCTADCLPQKKEGFIKYTVSFCKTTQELATKVWKTVEALHEKQGLERRNFSVKRVLSLLYFDE